MSTEQRIKDFLMSGKKLTSCTAAKTFLTADLRKYISNLRADGMEIKDKWYESAKGKRYKVYYCEG